ncbi:DUF4279 domain-containing protein [Leptospira koniambonensis]|uniref:DUF4279 domain-containing protein n=2 Tax=Leptospira koniambonensis TaxID=2484950 RepID=A0A4R9J4S3_9LEPT|nr:DUF4279 domain-containing protein [Leptospira koniambonensis]
MGLFPSQAWVKGDIDQKTNRVETYSKWCLYSRLTKEKSLEDHIIDVLDQLDSQADRIRKITSQFDGILQLVGYFHQYYPGLSLDSKTINRIASYNLNMDFDFYYLFENENEE